MRHPVPIGVVVIMLLFGSLLIYMDVDQPVRSRSLLSLKLKAEEESILQQIDELLKIINKKQVFADFDAVTDTLVTRENLSDFVLAMLSEAVDRCNKEWKQVNMDSDMTNMCAFFKRVKAPIEQLHQIVQERLIFFGYN